MHITDPTQRWTVHWAMRSAPLLSWGLKPYCDLAIHRHAPALTHSILLNLLGMRTSVVVAFGSSACTPAAPLRSAAAHPAATAIPCARRAQASPCAYTARPSHAALSR